jgi:hypothetical protein
MECISAHKAIAHSHWLENLRFNILWRIDPFLGSDRGTNNETTFAARKQLGKHVPAATETHAPIEVLLETESVLYGKL